MAKACNRKWHAQWQPVSVAATLQRRRHRRQPAVAETAAWRNALAAAHIEAAAANGFGNMKMAAAAAKAAENESGMQALSSRHQKCGWRNQHQQAGGWRKWR